MDHFQDLFTYLCDDTDPVLSSITGAQASCANTKGISATEDT